MPLSYGVSGGLSITRNTTNEYVMPQGTSGSVVTCIKKFSRTETTTETLPDIINLADLSTVPTWTRFELRLSNTDFARQTITSVTYGTIAGN